MNIIEHIVEPERLLLTWREPKDGRRYVVGELFREGSDIGFRYCRENTDFTLARKHGFTGHPAFPNFLNTYANNVLDTFMRRLPPRSRTDFPRYLEMLRLPADTGISDFALLGYSGAKLPGDGFALVHPFDNVEGPCELMIEVAGCRYHRTSTDDLGIGMPVRFVPEPDNKFDTDAIRIEADTGLIGYVMRAQLPAFHHWLKTGAIEAAIERINGTDERPLVYVFSRVAALRHQSAA